MSFNNTVVIESLDQEGRGIARIEGKVIFIEGALTGEVVSYSSYRKKPSFELAQVTQIHKPSPLRVQPKCAHFGVCGGCSMQHLDARAQVAVKQRILEDSLWHIGKVKAETILRPDLRADLGLSRARAALGQARDQEGQDAGRLPREAQQLCRRHAALRDPHAQDREFAAAAGRTGRAACRSATGCRRSKWRWASMSMRWCCA